METLKQQIKERLMDLRCDEDDVLWKMASRIFIGRSLLVLHAVIIGEIRALEYVLSLIEEQENKLED